MRTLLKLDFIWDICEINERLGISRISYRVSTRSATDCEGPCRLVPTEMKELLEKLQELQGDVRTLIIEEAHATKYFIRPGTDGQSERTFQMLENIFRACVRNLVVVGILTFCEMSFPTKIVIIRVVDVFSLEALYGKKCRSPVLWEEIRESSLIGPELVLETIDNVVLINEKLKAVRDRQKSYAHKRRKPLEFKVGDRILLKVSPWKGVMRFGKKGNLASRYVGPFEVPERIGLVAYLLRLLEELNSVHDTFHVSNLKKCLADAILHVPLDVIKVDRNLRL
nr:putative reverse transcriptase domain-containing protein [Tanacetum cinerariifolium]